MYKTVIQQQLDCLQKQICDIKKGGAEIEAIAILPSTQPDKKKFIITFVGGRQIETEFDSTGGNDIFIQNLVYDKQTGKMKAVLNNKQQLEVDISDVIGNEFI